MPISVLHMFIHSFLLISINILISESKRFISYNVTKCCSVKLKNGLFTLEIKSAFLIQKGEWAYVFDF